MSTSYIASDAELVLAARDGDERAWELIIQRYQPLVTAISRRYRLGSSDMNDISQQVWMRLLEHADRLREPRALPGWISTTAARACQELLRLRRRSLSMDPLANNGMEWVRTAAPEARSDDSVDEGLLRAERRQAVQQGLLELTETQQELLLLLVADPPVPYAVISERMGLAMGSIGPTRARLLKKLEKTTAVRRLTEDTTARLPVAA